MSDGSRRGIFARRHYRALAQALHSAGVDPQDRVLSTVISVLWSDNPRFNPARFRAWVADGDDGTARRFPS